MSKAKNLRKLSTFNVPKFEELDFTFLDSATDEEINEKISNIHSNLKANLYAVRSSANVEDSSSKSYAGIFDSYIEVKPEKLTEKVLSVFQKIEHSDLYKENKTIEMSVIVQVYIPAKYSGVTFTNMDGQLLISVHDGKCDDLVSGKVSGKEIIIDRETFCFFRKPEFDLNYSFLIRTFLRIERLFGTPQDIEWIIDSNEKLWIVQSRNITA